MFKAILLILIGILFFSCEGTSVSPALKFYGTYSVSESCGSGTTTFTMQIQEASNSPGQVIIKNFGDFGGDDIIATATNNKLEFTFKTGNLIITGSGVINESQNSIQFIYQTSGLGTSITDNCSAVAIKK